MQGLLWLSMLEILSGTHPFLAGSQVTGTGAGTRLAGVGLRGALQTCCWTLDAPRCAHDCCCRAACLEMNVPSLIIDQTCAGREQPST